MSYDTCEDALTTIIKLLDDYSDANVSQGDYRILGKGITRAIVTTPGPFERNHQAAGGYVRTVWTINIELFIPFKGELSTIADQIRSYRQTLIDHLDKYPTLNGTAGVTQGFLQGAGEPEIWRDKSLLLYMQGMTFVVDDRNTVTFAE